MKPVSLVTLALLSVAMLSALPALGQGNYLYFKSNVQSGTGDPDFIGQGWEQTWDGATAVFVGDTNGFEDVTIDVSPSTPPDECWAFCGWSLVFGGPVRLLSPGTYDVVELCSGSRPCLRFSGDSRGCNDIVGQMTVLEVGYLINSSDNKAVGITKFAADFWQKCLDTFGGDPIESVPSLDGIVRFQSSISPGISPIFLDGFESGGVSAWSSSG